MKITELKYAIIDAIKENKFVGDFEVQIYYKNEEKKSILGSIDELYNNFEDSLHSAICSRCYNILEGKYDSDGYDFKIIGSIEYSYDSFGDKKC